MNSGFFTRNEKGPAESIPPSRNVLPVSLALSGIDRVADHDDQNQFGGFRAVP